jgi:transcriptional regulator of arginine metabolism
LTDLHNQRYFMQVCDENATIMHLLASEGGVFGQAEVCGHLMLKRERQKKLLNLIRAKRIGTQEALREHLERAGVPATQSSLSRDLEELGVVKHRGAYALPHANGESARGLLSLDVAGDVLVIARCLPGLASAVAVEIDDAALPEIVGTLAGEDTIVIAVREQKAQRTVMKKFWELVSG